MSKVSLVPPSVNLQRRIPQHQINFTYGYTLKITYLSYCFQDTNDNNDINDNNDVIKRVLFFDFYTFNFDIFLILLDATQGLYYLALAL